MSGLFDYRAAEKIAATDPPFDALIMAAAMKADGHGLAGLRAGFPQLLAETTERYQAPGGRLRRDGTGA